ncbi:MAG: hypothetical protein FVQ82_15280 [Planctomycetes bacterium]|nr:hypothetical protein [Planctomycetota bacterium]
MEIKYTIQGLLIYIAIAAYAVGFLLAIFRIKKVAGFVYFLGFGSALAAFIYRGLHVGHIPMQNLFEVFVTLGMLVYPITLFSRKVLRVPGGPGDCADMLIGIIVLFPAGFVAKFSADPQQLPPALQCWLFAPHVAVYMLSYMIMAKAAFLAGARIAGAKPAPEENLLAYEDATYRMVCAGFPLLTLGLILGSWWGKLAWGDYWGWDPKELWSLVSWLVYLGYFHFRTMYGKKYPKANSTLAILGMVAIIITLLWVNLSKLFPGLHSYA